MGLLLRYSLYAWLPVSLMSSKLFLPPFSSLALNFGPILAISSALCFLREMACARSTTLARMYAMALRGELVDLSVTCGHEMRQTFGVHCAVVAAECGYFRTMQSTLVGASTTAHASLECEPSTFERVLECIYLSGLNAAALGPSLTAVFDVLALGVFLDCEVAVQAACAHLERAVTANTALELWERTHALGSSCATRVALRAVARYLPCIARTGRFTSLAKVEVLNLLSSDELSVRTETHVSDALCSWCDANAESCSALDSVVRYAWRDASPRAEAAVRGILVACSASETPRFLSESEEWIDAPVPPLRSQEGAGLPWKGTGLICDVGDATYAIGTVHNYGIEYAVSGASRWSTYSIPFGRPQAACAVLGTRIHVVGGISGVPACEDIDVHDVSTGLKGNFYMRVARRKCCAAAMADGILVFGGIDSAGHVLSHAELLLRAPTTEATGLCAMPSVPPMLSPRAAAASAVIGARVYVAGGLGSMRADTSTAEYYDAEAVRWLSLPPMPRSRSQCAGVAMGGAFYVIGGFEYGVEAASYFRLEIETLEWTTHDAPALGECSAVYFERTTRVGS